MSIYVDLTGLEALQGFFSAAPATADEAARLSVIDASAFARRESSKKIRSEVNFTVSYLGKDGRLEVVKTGDDHEATLRGRHRATSLANDVFRRTAPVFGRPKGRRGVRVSVKRGGGSKEIPGGFFLRLNNGNIGLAVRSDSPPSRGAKPIFGGAAWLLYGPSVGQVAYDVFPEIAPDVADKLVYEFVRHFERLTPNGR